MSCTQIVSTLDFRNIGLGDLQKDMQSVVLLSPLQQQMVVPECLIGFLSYQVNPLKDKKAEEPVSQES